MSFLATYEILEKLSGIQRRVLDISNLAAEQDCGVTISSMLSGAENAIVVTVYIWGEPLLKSSDSCTWFYDSTSPSCTYEGMCRFLDDWELKIKFPNESVGICEIPIDCGKQSWDGQVWECPHCHTEFMVDSGYFSYCPSCGCGLDK